MVSVLTFQEILTPQARSAGWRRTDAKKLLALPASWGLSPIRWRPYFGLTGPSSAWAARLELWGGWKWNQRSWEGRASKESSSPSVPHARLMHMETEAAEGVCPFCRTLCPVAGNARDDLGLWGGELLVFLRAGWRAHPPGAAALLLMAPSCPFPGSNFPADEPPPHPKKAARKLGGLRPVTGRCSTTGHATPQGRTNSVRSLRLQSPQWD